MQKGGSAYTRDGLYASIYGSLSENHTTSFRGFYFFHSLCWLWCSRTANQSCSSVNHWAACGTHL